MIDQSMLSRVKLVQVEPIQILGILQGDLSIEIKGVPDGSQVLHVYFSDPHRAFFLVVHHESFDEVPKGVTPPELEAVLTWKSVVECPSCLEDGRKGSLDNLTPFDEDGLDRIEKTTRHAYEHGSPPGYHTVSFRGILRLVKEIKDRRALDSIPDDSKGAT